MGGEWLCPLKARDIAATVKMLKVINSYETDGNKETKQKAVTKSVYISEEGQQKRGKRHEKMQEQLCSLLA